MKEEDGLRISCDIKAIDSLIKIIILTGYPSYETAIDAMRLGVFDYVSKAADSDEIFNKIKNAVENRSNDIVAKGQRASDRKSIILICNHVMIREGYENFCNGESEYCLTHTYHSIDYVKRRDFNNDATMVLICRTCNNPHLEEPEEVLPKLGIIFPNARLVIINCQSSDEKKKDLIKLGVKGFLPKNILKENMKKAFKSILSGQFWVSRKVAHSLLNEMLDKTTVPQYKKPQNTFNLSNREIEILQAIASGLSNLEISNKLFISEKTVKAHINHIFKKMKVKSRTQAVQKAVSKHII